MRDISVIIPAATPGARMRGWGPRPLVEIAGGQTIIGRQLAIIRSLHPKAEVVVVAGLGSERLFRVLPPWVKVVENELYAETGVVRSIGMGLRVASHPNALVVYGDLVFNHEAVRSLVGPSSAVLLDSSGQIEARAVGATVSGGRAMHFDFDLSPRWAQMTFLRGRELDLFKSYAWSPQGRRALGFEALNAVINGGGRLKAVEPKNLRIVEVDVPGDISRTLKVDA